MSKLRTASPGTNASPSLSKTFEYRWKPFRYRPDEIVSDPIEWLDQQPGIVGSTWNLHVVPGNAIRGVTLNCVLSSDQVTHRPRFERIPLISGFGGRRRIDLATALNDWNDEHPDCLRIGYRYLSAAGHPVDIATTFTSVVRFSRWVQSADGDLPCHCFAV